MPFKRYAFAWRRHIPGFTGLPDVTEGASWAAFGFARSRNELPHPSGSFLEQRAGCGQPVEDDAGWGCWWLYGFWHGDCLVCRWILVQGSVLAAPFAPEWLSCHAAGGSLCSGLSFGVPVSPRRSVWLYWHEGAAWWCGCSQSGRGLVSHSLLRHPGP